MNDLILTATKRTEMGKANARLRSAGMLPAIAYGHDLKSEPITLEAKVAEKLYAQAGSAKLISLKIGEGKARSVIFHDVQHDPRTGALTHADLYVVRMDEMMKAEVPLHFVGESTAVYQLEGSLMKGLETVEIECLPKDLPESIEVDISILDDFEKTITVADLIAPKGATILAEEPESVLVAKVEAPRSDEELADLEAPIDEASEIPENAQEEQPSVVTEENEGDKDRRDKK
jgi:large subunit ribosomal protein L25